MPDNEPANDDQNIVLDSIFVKAIQEKAAEPELRRFRDLAILAEKISEIDVFSAVPAWMPLPYPSAGDLLDDISGASSAKELIIAIQEYSERLRNQAYDDDESDTDSTGDELSVAKQSIRLVRIYARAIPRLPKSKRTPEEALRPLLTQLIALLTAAAPTYTQQDTQDLLSEMAGLVRSVAPWVTEGHSSESHSATGMLHKLIADTLEVFANQVDADIAQRTFEKQFPRLVMPDQEGKASSSTRGHDVAHDAWTTLRQIGVSEDQITTHPSIGNLILLAHSSTTPTLTHLSVFLPTMLTSIQTNTALSSTLSLLLSALGPMRTAAPRPTLSPELALPFAHLLPHLAAAHPAPETRHTAFRTLALVLALSPPTLRMQLLHGLLADADTPPQMRVAGVGLVKEALLEALAQDTENVFATTAFVDVFRDVLFRADLPEMGDVEESLQEFLESAEPVRLVECFGLVYVLLQRDRDNKTGIRSPDVLRSLRTDFIVPVKEHLGVWNKVDLEDSEEAGMQMRILDMWVHKILDAIDGVEKGL